MVNLKCICWVKSKCLDTSGINKIKGAAVASQLTLHGDPQKGEFTELLGTARETLAPVNSAVPSSSPGDGRRSTHLFGKLPPSLKCSQDRGTKKKNSSLLRADAHPICWHCLER